MSENPETPETPESPENQFLSVIRVWAAMAWADGVIADQEAEAMKRLISGADLTDEEKATALSWLESEVSLDTSNISELSDQARRGIYRAAVRLAGVDMHVAEEERAFLLRLREGLGLEEEVAREIEDSVPPPPARD